MLTEFEQQNGIKLPDEYRRFLLEYQGGNPEQYIFDFKHHNGRQDGAAICYFLGFYEDHSASLVVTYHGYQGHILHDLFPIAFDYGDNLICIGIGEDNFGKIYFWDHDGETDVYFVANSITEFLALLHEE